MKSTHYHPPCWISRYIIYGDYSVSKFIFLARTAGIIKQAGNTRRFARNLLALIYERSCYSFNFSIIMRKNRFPCPEKKPKQVERESEEELQKYQTMGGHISTKYRQIGSFEADSEIAKYKHPRTEKIATAKPEAVVLKRRRAFSECENSPAERQRLCKKLRVNQLYTGYCGRNSYMAAFFKLLGEFIKIEFTTLFDILFYFVLQFLIVPFTYITQPFCTFTR